MGSSAAGCSPPSPRRLSPGTSGARSRGRSGGRRSSSPRAPSPLGVAMDRARLARRPRAVRRGDASAGVGPVPRASQLAHRADGDVPLALARAGALDGARPSVRPLARAGGGRARDRGGRAASRRDRAPRRVARPPHRALLAGHGRVGLVPGRRLGQLVDPRRVVAERGGRSGRVDALPRRHHGGGALAPGVARARGPFDAARAPGRAAQRALDRRRIGARLRCLQRAGERLPRGAAHERASPAAPRVPPDAGARLDDDAVDRRAAQRARPRRTSGASPERGDAARVRARGGDRHGVLDCAGSPVRELRPLPRRPTARGVRQRHGARALCHVRDRRRRRGAPRSRARRLAAPPRAVPGDRAALEHPLPVRRRRPGSSLLEPRGLEARSTAFGQARTALSRRGAPPPGQALLAGRPSSGVPRGPRGRRATIVVFVSDHGEQLGEHGRIGHTWSMHDEEVRVPLWIDAPRGHPHRRRKRLTFARCKTRRSP